MFDRLVESQARGAVRSRKNYFIVSTLSMAMVSLTAVVVSIFADDYAISPGIELSELISPVEMAEVAPDQPRQQTARTNDTKVATRQSLMARTDEPTLVPTTTSVIQNTQLSRPATGPVTIAPFSTDTRGQGGGDRSTGPGDGTATTGISAATIATTPVEDAPLPVKKAESPKPLKSGGVLNGKAVSLPLPVYSAAAQAVNAQGRVTVQVTVDESGHVISAAAVDGNVLLRRAAEDAARKARFTPTYLSKVPVKVTGVIVYNFNRG